MEITLDRHEMFCLWRLLEKVSREAFMPEPNERGYGPTTTIAKSDWTEDDQAAIVAILRRLTVGY